MGGRWQQRSPMKRRNGVHAEFRNIRVLPSGYQVSITRAKIEFSRHFAGHSEESMRRAIAFRDEALKKLPRKRLNPIPRRVLTANNLDEPVIGVFRNAAKFLYQVTYYVNGHARGRAFGWTIRSEAEAYRLAVAFRKKVIRGKKVL